MRNFGVIFAVSFAGIILSTTINPDVLQSTALYNLEAYDFTSGMHKVVIFGGCISLVMALLSLAGLKEKLDLEYVKNKMNGLVGK
jgi:Na+-transporting NADH:ubiquinone oxidoreductase subunit NqrE